MSMRRVSLEVLNVPNPCSVPWKSMAGDDQVRFCMQCNESVYNLSAMTPAEAEHLLQRMEKPCVRFYRQIDGTVLATDRSGNRVARSWRRLAATTVAMFVTLASLVGCDCSKLGLCTQGKIVAPPGTKATVQPALEEPDEEDESQSNMD